MLGAIVAIFILALYFGRNWIGSSLSPSLSFEREDGLLIGDFALAAILLAWLIVRDPLELEFRAFVARAPNLLALQKWELWSRKVSLFGVFLWIAIFLAGLFSGQFDARVTALGLAAIWAVPGIFTFLIWRRMRRPFLDEMRRVRGLETS